MKKVSIVLFVLILSTATNVFAAEITIDNNVIPVTAGTTRQADFTVTSNFPDNFTVRIKEAVPWMSVSNSRASAAPGESSIITLYFSPSIDAMLGTYGSELIIKSLISSEEFNKPF
ncbi:hypothetical protein ACFLQN_03295, partial [Candidatus Aenigmatarchaeota archaeon]